MRGMHRIQIATSSRSATAPHLEYATTASFLRTIGKAIPAARAEIRGTHVRRAWYLDSRMDKSGSELEAQSRNRVNRWLAENKWVAEALKGGGVWRCGVNGLRRKVPDDGGSVLGGC